MGRPLLVNLFLVRLVLAWLMADDHKPLWLRTVLSESAHLAIFNISANFLELEYK
jgi:hypothetical protein